MKAARAHQIEADRIRWRGIFEANAESILGRLLANYATDRDDISDSDLDNEQPIAITFRGQLGDIRNARTALQCLRALRGKDEQLSTQVGHLFPDADAREPDRLRDEQSAKE